MMREAVKQRRAALTSRLQSFETEVLAQEENLAGLATLNRELIARAEASMPSKRLPTEREWRSAGEGATPKRHWTDAEKLAMVRECETPGSSVSVVSRRYDINSNMLFNWRNQVRRGVIGYGKSARPIPDFVPVTIIDDARQCSGLYRLPTLRIKMSPRGGRGPWSRQAAPKLAIRANQIELPTGVCVRFDSSISEAILRHVLASLAVQS